MGKEMMVLILSLLILFNANHSSSSSSIQLEGELQGSSAAGGGCSGKRVGECGLEMEMEMDSEMNNKRRALFAAAAAGKRYISYEALRGDNVPCNRPGIPYYNCHALPKANPYSRGCSVITRCRGD